MTAESCNVGEGLPPLPGDVPGPPERPVRSRWQRFEQHMGLDLRSLALFRVLVAGLLLQDLAARATWLRAFYTDEGVAPLAQLFGELATSASRQYVSLHTASGAPFVQGLLFLVAALCAVGLLIGWRTRLMTVLCWVLLVSLQNRNWMVVNAGDSLLRIVLFWGIWLPLGARWSVDSAMNPAAVVEPARRNDRLFGIPAMAFVLQICLVYWMTATLKTDPAWISDHTAVRQALMLDYLVRPLGEWMRTLGDGFLGFVTVATLVVEWAVPLLLWVPVAVGPLRTLAVLLMCGLHFGFLLTLSIGLFAPVCIVCWLALLPPWFWDRLFARLRRDPRRTGVTIWFDADCGFCQRMALLLRTFFLLPETRIRRSTDDPKVQAEMAARDSWILEAHDGTRTYAWDAVVEVLRLSPWAFPLSWLAGLPPVRWLGHRVYRFVATHRGLMGRLTGWMRYRPRHVPATRWRWVRDGALVAVMAYVLLWNGRTLHTNEGTFEQGTLGAKIAATADEWMLAKAPFADGDWRWFGNGTRLSQQWNMFAPRPSTIRGWYRVVGDRVGGPDVDVYRAVVLGEAAPPPSRERPARVADTYPDARWRKFMMNLRKRSRAAWSRPFCHWLARRWHAAHPAPEDRLQSVTLWFHRERVKRDGTVTPLQPQRVGHVSLR